jgi:phage anti-repressor protein
VTQRAIGQQVIPAVSARELHRLLGIQERFTDWMQQYLTGDDWRKSLDFSVLLSEVKNPQGGRPPVDYALSIAMAEHLAASAMKVKGKDYSVLLENLHLDATISDERRLVERLRLQSLPQGGRDAAGRTSEPIDDERA